MSRTAIDPDDDDSTEGDAVELASADEPHDVDAARRMRGSGWEGDLDQMRQARIGATNHPASFDKLPSSKKAGIPLPE
jgi:hypothetical protein